MSNALIEHRLSELISLAGDLEVEATELITRLHSIQIQKNDIKKEVYELNGGAESTPLFLLASPKNKRKWSAEE